MRVKAVWKPEQERTGTVTDLRYFRPITAEEEEAAQDAEPEEIKPAELTTVTARSFPGRIPLDYAYTAGLGGRRFPGRIRL